MQSVSLSVMHNSYQYTCTHINKRLEINLELGQTKRKAGLLQAVLHDLLLWTLERNCAADFQMVRV